MAEGYSIKIYRWLLPLSWLYGLAVALRNALFDMGLLKTRSFRVPVIAVGNLTVGGTGKTPHVEYIVSLLRDKASLAVLSRGYKRKTRGFVLADDESTAETIGDEPMQIKAKFPEVKVAVCANRCRGIDMLTDGDKGGDTDVVVLDDAFQHRYVKPGINILLVDCGRLITHDRLLPAGRLREPLSAKDRADMVIVTKCPPEMRPVDYRVLAKSLGLYPYQHLYFTRLTYEPLRPVFGGPVDRAYDGASVLLLTGIASPRHIIDHLRREGREPTCLTFGDHHRFRPKDVENINRTFSQMADPKIIITTEKDAARLASVEGLSDCVRQRMFQLPVRVEFLLGGEAKFNENIIGYVRKNSRNSILAKTKDDHRAQGGHNTWDRPRTISFRNN